MGHPPPPVHTTTARDRASGWLQVSTGAVSRPLVDPIGASGRMLVAVGLKRPEREDDRRSRSFFGGSTWWGPAELALWEGRHDEAGAAVAEGLRWCAERDPDRTLLQRTSRWYALALRLEADRAERAAARWAPKEVAAARRRAAPVLATLDRLAPAPTPQAGLSMGHRPAAARPG